MKSYEWMVTYTPQTVWIERKGILIWLSFYIGMLGGGTYLAALYFGSQPGMALGWLIILFIKTGLHLAHAERPSRLWRMMLRPQTSWISRGLILTILFIVFGALQIACSLWQTGSGIETLFRVLAGVCAFGIIVYAGFTMSCVRGVPFWNSALLPVLFLLWAFLTGLTLVQAIDAHVDTRMATAGNLVLLITSLIFVAIYLGIASYGEPAVKESVRTLTKGRLVPVLFIGIILIGMVIPLAISFSGYVTGALSTLSDLVLTVCIIVGGLSLTYATLKAGLYNPLPPTRS
jgi:formate-dependent nitrite reductase membrane component NrfD